jgi:hypothetical protein
VHENGFTRFQNDRLGQKRRLKVFSRERQLRIRRVQSRDDVLDVDETVLVDKILHLTKGLELFHFYRKHGLSNAVLLVQVGANGSVHPWRT